MAIIRSAAVTNGKNPDELFKTDVNLKDEHVDTSNFSDLVRYGYSILILIIQINTQLKLFLFFS